MSQTGKNSKLSKSTIGTALHQRRFSAKMKEKDKVLQEEQYEKKMENDKNKLEQEKQERDRQIAELMEKLKASEMERRDMERKLPSDKSKYRL